jgi:hypothetical protein
MTDVHLVNKFHVIYEIRRLIYLITQGTALNHTSPHPETNDATDSIRQRAFMSPFRALDYMRVTLNIVDKKVENISQNTIF